MPSGIINLTENEKEEDNVIIRKRDTDRSCGPNQHLVNNPKVRVVANSETNKNEGERSNKGLKRGNYYHELWSESDSNLRKKRMRVESEETNDEDNDDNIIIHKQCNEPFGYVTSDSGEERAYVVNSTICVAPRRARRKRKSCAPKTQICRKPYYRKRRYCCPGKRRYKATKRCCPGKKYNRNRINLCNRNWARISVNPFINFLRVYRRKFCKGTPISEIARKGKCEWQKMSCNSKKRFYEQAKRARIRGYRT